MSRDKKKFIHFKRKKQALLHMGISTRVR